ncbi:exo-alpha-sialidase [bacterium]|nr:exo-alpha-sialidase [bacterium]
MVLILACAWLGVLGCGVSRHTTGSPRDEEPRLVRTHLFVSGEGGYHTYRIPALAVTRRGSLLAFCEGRKRSRSDSGDIDVVMRRSRDGGASWEPTRLLFDAGPDTWGNPAPVVDARTGRILLLTTRNPGDRTERDVRARRAERSVWLSHSDDDGATWSAPREITRRVKSPDWRWYATGPGHAIQLSSGRLLVPCDHSVPLATGQAGRSHVILSDDGGDHWRIGGILGDGVNECMAAELPDGRVYLNMRSYRGMNRRAVAYSHDGGESFGALKHDPVLVEPVCQASVLGWPLGKGEFGLLFCNPASERRERLTLRLSYDGGATWPVLRLLHEGPAAYSDLALLPEGDVACMYENGVEHPYEKITLARFNRAWLLNGDN